MAFYIEIEGSTVTKLVNSDKDLSDSLTPIPEDAPVSAGMDIREFNPDWTLKPLSERVEKGFIELRTANEHEGVPAGTVMEKLVGEEILPKTAFDLASEGALQIGADLKLDHEKQQVVPKTPYELAIEGLEELDFYEYLDHESQTVKTATSVAELLDAGKLSQEEADAAEGEIQRGLRTQKLMEIDAIAMNPLRYGELQDDQKDALKHYRQQLLDVPQQAGFPWDIEWPEKPYFI